MGAACRRPSYVEGMRLRRRFCCSVLIAGAATLGPLAAPTIGASAPCDAPGTERVDLTTADGVSVAGFVQGAVRWASCSFTRSTRTTADGSHKRRIWHRAPPCSRSICVAMARRPG